jgi:hypothetical protein
MNEKHQGGEEKKTIMNQEIYTNKKRCEKTSKRAWGNRNIMCRK